MPKEGTEKYGILTCPRCGYKQRMKIPSDRCVISYECNGCNKRILAKKDTCCVFCSYADKPCPYSKKL